MKNDETMKNSESIYDTTSQIRAILHKVIDISDIGMIILLKNPILSSIYGINLLSKYSDRGIGMIIKDVKQTGDNSFMLEIKSNVDIFDENKQLVNQYMFIIIADLSFHISLELLQYLCTMYILKHKTNDGLYNHISDFILSIKIHEKLYTIDSDTGELSIVHEKQYFINKSKY